MKKQQNQILNSVRNVDHVIGDNEAIYSGFDKDFPKVMTKIFKDTDCILPNISESSNLIGILFAEEIYDKAYIKKIFIHLIKFGL